MFHILEHDGFISTGAQMKIHRGKCALGLNALHLLAKETPLAFLVCGHQCVCVCVCVDVWACAYTCICVSANDYVVIATKGTALKTTMFM